MIEGIPPKPPKKVLPLGATSSNQQQQQNNQNPNQNKQEQDNPNKDFATILAEQMRQGDTNDNANDTTQERSLSNPNGGGIKTNPRLDRGEQGQSQEFSKARGGNPATYNESLARLLTERAATSEEIQAGSGAVGRGSGNIEEIYNAADSFSIQEYNKLRSLSTTRKKLEEEIKKQYAIKAYKLAQNITPLNPPAESIDKKHSIDSKSNSNQTQKPNKPKPRGR